MLDPKNPDYNFQLAYEYERQFHTASAAGYYLRTTEHSRDDLQIYEALIRMALCFHRQGGRVFTVTGLLMRAIALIPDRPEAYFLLCRTYEQNKEWQEAYTWSVIGEQKAYQGILEPLQTNVEYPGTSGFEFERAVAAWWIGRYDESLFLFRQLRNNPELDGDYVISVRDNLRHLDNDWKEPLLYTANDFERLKIKFPGAKDIKKNFSQCYQDLFVLTMLDGKRDGSFLEIGSGGAYYGSNTVLLEQFGWTGTSVDKSPESIVEFKKWRLGKAIAGDGSTMDFSGILDKPDIDYLQIDCDPAQDSLLALFNIPFNNHRFAVITFEHDHYRDESATVKDRSRAYLRSLGYVLVVDDVGVNDFDSFEDWWVHPGLMSKKGLDLIKHFNHYNSDPNRIDKCMFH